MVAEVAIKISCREVAMRSQALWDWGFTNTLNLTASNPSLDLVNINAYINFSEILSICSQDIERKRCSGVN